MPRAAHLPVESLNGYTHKEARGRAEPRLSKDGVSATGRGKRLPARDSQRTEFKKAEATHKARGMYSSVSAHRGLSGSGKENRTHTARKQNKTQNDMAMK